MRLVLSLIIEFEILMSLLDHVLKIEIASKLRGIRSIRTKKSLLSFVLIEFNAISM